MVLRDFEPLFYTPEPSLWQPIATAPTDGTDILVGSNFASVWIVHVAWYRNEGVENGCAGPQDIGWWSYVRHCGTQEMLIGHYAPTHWLPLPTPPEVSVHDSSELP